MGTEIDFGLKIRELIKEKSGDLAEGAERLGYTRTGIYKAIGKKDVSTELLKKVCKTYNVGMSYFLTDNNVITQTGKFNSVGESQIAYKSYNSTVEESSAIKLLEEKIRGLERENELLRDMVEMLKTKAK